LHLPLGRQAAERRERPAVSRSRQPGAVMAEAGHFRIHRYGAGEYRFRVYGRYAAGETMYAG